MDLFSSAIFSTSSSSSSFMYILLAIIGACLGSLLNLCIYRLGDKKKAFSPWSKPNDNQTRNISHYVPILGWFYRRKELTTEKHRNWLRPLCIELAMSLFLPCFYYWQLSGGLLGGSLAPPPSWPVWFVGHSILIALLIVATFIDFDERIIPDSITVTGTLIALAIASYYPGFRLPIIGAMKVGGPVIVPLDFADGAALPTWHTGALGICAAVGIYWTWILALLPKMPLVALNWRALKLVFFSTVRLLQKNKLKMRAKYRRKGQFFIALGFAGTIAIFACWYYMPNTWESLFGALIGLGFGGMMIWLVRIVASHSLGQEAMGFGDVTLMAMVGAFLGWQVALLAFVFSPFAALAISLANYVLTGENELAFGPYLCFGATITLFGWSAIWPAVRIQFFAMPEILIGVLLASLIMLAGMMRIVRKLKGLDDPIESNG